METFIDDRIYAEKKAIAFDLDWTLMWYADGLYPKSDIRWMPGRVQKLSYLRSKGWSFIIFTNQKKYNQNRIKLAFEMIKEIGPCAIFVGISDEFRKPEKTMYENYREQIPNCKLYTFVGDAAGRPQDFSDSDLQFAKAAGLRFLTPEVVFKEQRPVIPASGKHIILLMGMPGSGKTTFATKWLGKYIRINQDTLKTHAKVIKATSGAMEEGKLICIDNTNGSSEKREEFENLAEEYGYQLHIWYVVRNGYGWNKLRETPVPDIAYHVYFKNLSIPDNVKFIG
jgi:bifunctional polynucleotide phosphatase/kinase